MYDVAHKYCFCLHSDPKHNQKAFLLLLELENYVNGAIIQTARLERTRKATEKKLREQAESIKDGKYTYKSNKKDFSLTKLHCDYHFYFTCIGQINRLLKRLYEVLDDPDLKGVHTNFKVKFNKDIRDDLEHLDERAVGKKFRQEIGHISDFGNFPGDRFSFNGKEFPVNKEKLKELTQIYGEIIQVLHKNYGSKDPSFIMWEQREIQRKAILRQLKKQNLI